MGLTHERMWSGMAVRVLDTPGGYFVRRATPTHYVAMCLAATRTVCRCGGPPQYMQRLVGDVDVVPAGMEAMWNDERPGAYVAIDLTPALVNATAAKLGVNPERIEIVPGLVLTDPQIAHIASALKLELEHGEPNRSLYAETLGAALAARLIRRYSKMTRPHAARGLSKRQLSRVNDYVTEHIDDDLSLSVLAAVAGMGISQFKAMFRSATGMPVHQFIIRRRVQEAARLLSHDRAPIGSVAAQAGFADQSHMARCMRRVLGTTPGAMRRGSR